MQVFLNLNPKKLFHMEHFFSGFIFFLIIRFLVQVCPVLSETFKSLSDDGLDGSIWTFFQYFRQDFIDIDL